MVAAASFLFHLCSVDESLHKLSDEEIHFLIKYALKLIPTGTLQDMQRGTPEKRAMALELATDVVMAQLGRADHQIYRPERDKGPLFGLTPHEKQD